MRRWLLAPAAALVVIVLIIPLIQILSFAVRDPAMRDTMPATAGLLRGWDGRDLPDETVFAAAAQELAAAEARQAIGGLAQRLDFARGGLRTLVIRTGQASLAPPYRDTMAALDPRWGETALWQTLRRASGPITWLYLLRAVDLEMTPGGAIVAVPPDRAVFLALFGRTLLVGLGVTVLCLLIGYPVAYAIAQLRPSWARLAMALVLIDAALLVLDHPSGPVFNRLAVHVLLPLAILPMLGAMRRVDPVFLRASASLGAPGWMGFARVYLPLTMPGVGAAALIVFMLAVGFYVTPVLAGLDQGLAAALGVVLAALVALVVASGRLLLFTRAGRH